MAVDTNKKYIQDPNNPYASIPNPNYIEIAPIIPPATTTSTPVATTTQSSGYKTLYDFYKSQGQGLPTIADRAKTYEALGLGAEKDYIGDTNQNISLLNKLQQKTGTDIKSQKDNDLIIQTPETFQEKIPETRLDLYTSLRERLGLDTAEKALPSKASIYDTATKQVEEDKTKLRTLDDRIAEIEKSIKQSEDDIRNRITASGGLVTESQVQRLVASEKKPLIDYYNELIENRNRLAGNITEAEKTAIQRAEAEYTDQISAYQRLQDQLTELYNAGEADMVDKAEAAIAAAEAKQGKYIGMQSDNNGNVTVVTQNPDGSYSTQSIGQIGKADKTKATTQTDEADEASLEEAQTRVNDINNLIYATNEDGTLNTKKYSKGLQKSAQLGIAVFPGNWIQEYQSANDEDIARFIGGVEQLISSGTIKNLIDAKAQGATFGALSDRELEIIAASFSKIGRWKVETKDGRVIGYNVSAKDMAEELNRIKASSEKVINDLQGKIPTESGGDSIEEEYQNYLKIVEGE
jgi:hypothetical protein